MADLFESATKQKLRFETKIGQLSAEDLWDIPLTTTRANQVSLDEIAIALDKTLKETATQSFVKKPDSANDTLRLKFDVVLQVIKVKQEDEAAAELKLKNTEKKKQILDIIAKKENEDLAGKSIEELRQAIDTL